MNHNEIFGNAIWVKASRPDDCPVIRTNFDISKKVTKATLYILGLGTYVFFVNGNSVTDDMFQPINSNYENRDFPKGEVMAVRSYVNSYDITEFLKQGRNTIATMLGNGWYDGTRQEKPYGCRKLCLSIMIETEDGVEYVGTSLKDKFASSFVKRSNILEYEVHDYTEWDENILTENYDDSELPCVEAAKPLETEYFFSDCPRDGVVEEILPRIVGKIGNDTIYDAGANISGIPVLRSRGTPSTIKIHFSEELTADGDVEEAHSMWQSFEAKVGDQPVEIKNIFSWYGFRYFKEIGRAHV